MHVLIDEERYAQLENEARSTGRSVGSIVREAIDRHLESQGEAERQANAAQRLLERTVHPLDTEPDWAETKAAIVAAQERGG